MATTSKRRYIRSRRGGLDRLQQPQHSPDGMPRSLIRLMVELGIPGREELRERAERSGNGWVWCVEYLGRHGERSSGDG